MSSLSLLLYELVFYKMLTMAMDLRNHAGHQSPLFTSQLATHLFWNFISITESVSRISATTQSDDLN